MTPHDDFSALLDGWVDGDLAPADRARIEQHLAECAACREELAALERLRGLTRALPRSVNPEADLWPPIARRLAPRRSWRPLMRTPWPAWARLAAALVLFLAGAFTASLLRGRGGDTSFAAEQRSYTEATARLARELADNPRLLSPAVRAVVERNLAVVDQAIREAEGALEHDRGNPALEQMLRARYEQRLELLRRATAAGRQES